MQLTMEQLSKKMSLADTLREELKRKHPMNENMKKGIIGDLRERGRSIFHVDNIDVEKFAIIDWAHENGLCAYDTDCDIVVLINAR